MAGESNDRAGEDADDMDEVEEQQIRTKSDLYRIFNAKGPTNMAAGFMSDVSLKQLAQILVIVTGPLENSYYKTLEQLAGGWNCQKEWVSERAIGDWLFTVGDILTTLESETLHNRLGLTKPLRNTALITMEVGGWLPRWATQELQTLNRAITFAASLAELYLWSNIHYWTSIPECLSGLLHNDREVRKEVLSHAKDVVEALLAAERLAKTLPKDSLLVALLQDLAWNKQQLPREAMALLLQSDFEDGSTEIRKLCYRLFTGSPSTKDVLENVFAFLHRKAAVNSTNQKFADPTKWAYTLMSPYCETGGCPQFLPTKEDFDTINSTLGLEARKWAAHHLYSPQKTLLPRPDAVPSPTKILATKFRTAGPLSQQRSAAAVQFLCADCSNRWKHIDLCWLGSLSKLFCEQLLDIQNKWFLVFVFCWVCWERNSKFRSLVFGATFLHCVAVWGL